MTHARTVEELRSAFERGATKPLAWRLGQLRALRRMLTERAADFEDALLADLAKNPTESQIAEIGFVIGEIDHTVKHLRRWLRPRRVSVPGALLPGARLHDAGAGRAGARDRALELPGAAAAGTARRGARGRERGRAEAERARAGDVRGDGPAHPAVPRHPGRRGRRGRGRGHDRPARPALGSHLLHRQRACRPDRRGGRGRAPHPGDPGARRQVARVRRPARWTSQPPRAGSPGASS